MENFQNNNNVMVNVNTENKVSLDTLKQLVYQVNTALGSELSVNRVVRDGQNVIINSVSEDSLVETTNVLR